MVISMHENYDNYISRNITNYYRRQLPAPIIYLVLLLIIWNIFSLSELLFPASFTAKSTLAETHSQNTKYVNAYLSDLYFTGYTRTFWGNTTGYYYYTMRNDECYIVLLSPRSCEEGLPFISELTVKAAVYPSNDTYQLLLLKLDQFGY